MNIVIKKTRNNQFKIIQHHSQVADLNQQKLKTSHSWKEESVKMN